MPVSPDNFVFGFFKFCITTSIVFLFSCGLLAWILSRILGASVGFRVGGCNSLRDVTLKFKKGAVESLSVGEIKLHLRHSLDKLYVDFTSWDPKLQLLISSLEVVTRPSSKSPSKKSPVKKKSQKSHSQASGSKRWMTISNIARYLSVGVTNLVLKTPKFTVEIREWNVDISKDVRFESDLLVRVNLLPIVVQILEPQVSGDQLSSFSGGYHASCQASAASTVKSSGTFVCEKISVSCKLGHNRDVGLIIKNVDISIGEVTVKLNEGILVKRKSSLESTSSSNRNIGSSDDPTSTKQPINKQQKLAGYSSKFPEKVSFNLTKLDVTFVHREYGISVENNIMGIQLKSIKSQCTEDVGEITRIEFQLVFCEIHLLREAGSSMLEILGIDFKSYVHVPQQSISPIRVETETNLGGLRCNIIMSRLKPWLVLHSSKKKKMVLREESPVVVKPQSATKIIIMWTCNVSTPEFTMMLVNLAGSPVYHGCLQPSRIVANNTSNMGTTIHVELGGLYLNLADEYKKDMKESCFGVESNSASIIHITKVTLDWGKMNMKSSEEADPMSMVGLSVVVTSIGVYLTLKRLESFISTAISCQALLKSLSKKSTQNRRPSSTKSSSGKGAKMLKFNLEQCSVYVFGESGLENTVVPDPKRVNYGSQGGRVIITVSEDGSPRNASIMSTSSSEHQNLKYSIALEIFNFKLCVNKEKQSTQVELERVRSIYQEYMEENMAITKVDLFDMQNTKFLRRARGKDNSSCSLFSATEITLRWEPDLHIALIELVLQLKSVVHNTKLQEYGNEQGNKKTEASVETGHVEKKKKESIIAVDVDVLIVSANLGDGVETNVRVQSIFSENASIGVFLEGIELGFNGARIFKSSRMQISRIPRPSSSGKTWDWVIQGLDVYICMAYRLQLRAIDDVFEDMMRALKLIVAAKTSLIFPIKKESSSKVKKPGSVKFGVIKFFIRKLTADIEEEPMQGWLDEHYQLLKKEVGEVAVRLNFLEKFVSKQDSKSTDEDNNSQEKKVDLNDGVEVDVGNSSSIDSMREEIYKRSFQSYYQACQKLVLSEGSGACNDGFQAGFKTSVSRSSLLTISASDLDVSLTQIDGGDDGMIEVVRKLDPVALECDIPFARLYGANIVLKTSSLAVLLRDYTFPLFAGTSGKCDGRLVLAQQATSFQPQIVQDVYVGRWRKVALLRSATGTTPPMKTYSDLPLHFQKGEVSYGVGYEPIFADISYAFTVVLRRANLSVINPGPLIIPPKKEKSLPWWDDMRNYIHGRISLIFSETKFHILATSDPYEKLDKLTLITNSMEIHQSDGRIFVSAKDFRIFLSTLESLANSHCSKIPPEVSGPFLEVPVFNLEVTMDWGCDSGTPLNHYLFSLPIEGKPREFVFDPFRSTSLSLRWNLSFKSENQTLSSSSVSSTTLKFGAHDLAWFMKFYKIMYLPPHKLRMFSRWPRYGVPRIVRSGNLSLDRVMTEFMIRLDSTPTCIKNLPIHDDDLSKGITFTTTKLKFELCVSRGMKKYTFECVRELLELVYLGIDLHVPKLFLNKEECTSVVKLLNMTPKSSQSENNTSEKGNYLTQKTQDDGFVLSCDYFTIRRQSPKADPASLVEWQEAGRRNMEVTPIPSGFDNGNEGDENVPSDQSDDEGYNVVIADNCWRVFVYGLKLLWNIENRDGVCSWIAGLAKACQPPKPSPSRQYAQRKLLEENRQRQQDDGGETNKDDHDGGETIKDDGGGETGKDGGGETGKDDGGGETHKDDGGGETHKDDGGGETHKDDGGAETHKDDGGEKCEDVEDKGKGDDEAKINHDGGGESETLVSEVSKSLPTGNVTDSPSSQNAGTSGSVSSPPQTDKVANLSPDDSKEGTRDFMVNVIEPQFNLHSEDANGRFLLAAVSGRVLAQSFHSVVHVGSEIIEQALSTTDGHIGEYQPEIAWKRVEMSVMLEHVQAHVAPTDVDLGAGVQWLPKIRKGSPKVMRRGLLERVFMPCDMYFQYTRHKGGTPELKVKPLKELRFNSHNITAAMTSRQFQVMLDVLSNLLFARLPKPRKSSLSLYVEDDEVDEEEADEVVPDGVEEVELAKIDLEKKEREQKLILDDIRKLSLWCDNSGDQHPAEKEGNLWMISGGRAMLVQGLKRELVSAKKTRKETYASLRVAMHKAAQLHLMEKEKNKSPSYAMRISLQINKVVWSMLLDGKSFAEAEICDMIFDFDRDYKDVGVSQLTTKYVVFKNCLPNAKSDMVLSAWNPPPEWGKKVMLRVDARQGPPKDGNSPFELFQVEIYPLKIHLTETMYRMMWGYFFPEEERDSQRRKEVWKVSTTAGARRVKKGQETSASNNPSTKESEALSKVDSAQASKAPKSKASPELKRTSSFDKSWEETVAESVADELVLRSLSSSKMGPFGSIEQQDEASKNKSKDSKGAKVGRPSNEEKKVARPKKMMEFHNIKISQVELSVTYEGQRFVVNDLKLLMDQFHRVEFTGTWRRLFSRVKKHVIWGVLKSVTGMQGKKFKDKGQSQSQPSGADIPGIDHNYSDTEGQAGQPWPKRPIEGAGDGFVTSVRGLFNTQRRKAKAFVLKTMKGEEEHDSHGEWSENDVEISPFARQLTIMKAKKLIRRHTKKLNTKGQKGEPSQQKESLPPSPGMAAPYDSDSSSESSPYEGLDE